MKVDFELIDSILKDHNYDATQVIGIMQDIQKEYRYLPEEGLKYAAEKIGISPAKIYGVATFYGNFSLEAKGKYVARMDTDDISRKDRFEKQLAEFEKDPELDICGSHILEFEENAENIVAQRKVPLDDKSIKEYQKRRDGFNHVAVMFKKSTVLRAGNYQSCLLMEDTLLWVNMIQAGAKCMNIDDSLVFVRIGKDMYERRGGFAYFKKYKQGRKKVRETGYIGFWDYYYSLSVQLAVALVPNKVRGFIFKKILHR